MTSFDRVTVAGDSVQTSAPISVRSAVKALGWAGHAVGRTKILGVWVYPVVSVSGEAHQRRALAGQGPVLDLDVLETWDWPETGPQRLPEVVRLRGVLSVRGSWRQAFSEVTRLRGFCADAIIVKADQLTKIERDRCELECSFADTALVYHSADSTNVRLPGRGGRSSGARRRTLDRWVEELIYQRLLADGVMA
jgi:hypothetical protein